MKSPRLHAAVAFVFAAMLGFSVPAIAAKGSGHAGPVEKIREATAQLSLSDDQQPKVDKILDDAQQQVAQLKQEAKSSGDRSAMREKAKSMMKETIGKLSRVLTPEQRGKLRELIKEARAEKKAEHALATQPAA